MISYETYKILHIFTLLMVMSSAGVIVSEGKWISKRPFKIILGVFSFLMFVGGMGLIARIGISHGEGFPAWIKLKIVAWILLNVFIVLMYKMVKLKLVFAILSLISILVAIYSAITKLA